MEKFKFVDLFSGIGGFHQAMSQLGGECVFASEIDKYCNETYFDNYHMASDMDIKKVDEKATIPPHDVLCAGFPCQSFSKAGKQEGLADSTRGTLFFEIERILKYHKTKYIILENVRNLVSHDGGNTWNVIQRHLKALGYRLTKKPIILSPHQFGIPQLRERVVILGRYDPENVEQELEISFEKGMPKEANSIYSITTIEPVDKKYNISPQEEMVLTAWNEFYQGISQKVIGFPIWAFCFNEEEIEDDFPKWKKGFYQKNKALYLENREFIDMWLQKYNYLEQFTQTQKKMEWQAGGKITSLWEGVIQFRPSGIRIKAPDCFPALVAMVQIPIIGKYRRRLTLEEASRLQSFPDDFLHNKVEQQAYKQLGNSVNVEVIKRAAIKLFSIE